jgi:5-methylcytosine-specific restriction endonuclease McrA
MRRQADNHDDYIVYQANYRCAKEGIVGILTVEEWVGLKADCGYKCLCCGKCEPEITLTPDHVIPRSVGGPNIISNIQPLCGSCNSAKRDKATDYRHVENSGRKALQEHSEECFVEGSMEASYVGPTSGAQCGAV